MTEPYTEAEVRAQFLSVVRSIADHWAALPDKTPAERIDGAIFSVLVLLDGENAAMPGFCVSPAPHPDDRDYHERRGERWYSTDVDIAGALHEQFFVKGA